MLTGDLVRVTIRGGVVQPRWLNPDRAADLDRAKRLIDIVQAHVNCSRGDLEDALRTETGHGRDFRARRGLAKLLTDRTESVLATSLSPTLVRTALFERAAGHQPLTEESRASVMAAVAQEMDTNVAELERALYADLASNQLITSFDPIAPDALLHRYNVALVQAVLVKTESMTVSLNEPMPKRIRQLLRYLKFFRLLYRVVDWDPGEAEDCPSVLRLKLDGPASILNQSQRYGLLLANFLPALLLCENWSLEAKYRPGRRRRGGVFHLDHHVGLRSHYQDTGTWVAAEERALVKRLTELAEGWEVTEDTQLVDLDGRDVVVPDILLRERATGRQVGILLIWRWRYRALQSRWSLIRKHGPRNLILAVCKKGKTDDKTEIPALPGRVHLFSQLPNARSLWKLVRETPG